MINIYSIIAPIALTLLVLEVLYCVFKKNGIYTFQESFTNLSTGMGNQVVNLVVMGIVFSLYEPLYLWSPFKFEESFLNMMLLLVLVDFIFYWVHRFGHEVNILWAAHSPHHSGEEMNLALALRASVTMRLASFFFFWPLALIGFSPQMIYAASGIQLILAFWHHTKLIGKMGWFEKYFNSPSHHRVHHGTNAKYLDKNYGEIFIIWDKMFGTFQAEEEEVNYGILRQPKSWNPLIINFHFWGMLFQDFKETKSYWDKARLWFMPLGWRPSDVRFREPVKPFEKGEYKRYESTEFEGARPYLILQLLLGLGAMLFAMNMKNDLTISGRVFFSSFLWLGMISWGAILESRFWGIALEVFKTILLSITLLSFSSFFGFSAEYIPFFVSLNGITLVWTIFIYIKNKKDIFA
jgi:sterol desaturase/sphingolipid hydroxylase (fatty acid hydroxylase superfamily)